MHQETGTEPDCRQRPSCAAGLRLRQALSRSPSGVLLLTYMLPLVTALTNSLMLLLVLSLWCLVLALASL